MSELGNRTTLGDVLVAIQKQLQLTTPYDWRDSAFSPEIDSLLADLALDTEKPDVAESAARAIGRIRSEAAVRVLAEEQRKGERGALRALALVRDEAPSLPKSVSQQARFITWMSNTWRRITNQPMRSVTRYALAAIFAGLAVWLYAYAELPSPAIFSPERWGKSLTTGITFGVVFGLVVLLAAEVPERLRGFWPWWARLILNLVLGIASGLLVWVVFDWFFLYYQPTAEDMGALFFGAIGTAAAFSLGVVFRIPGWLGVLWTTVIFYIPIYYSWTNFMPPLIYIRPGEEISWYGIPIAFLIGVGAYFPRLIQDARGLWRRLRRPPAQAAPTTPAATASA